MKDKNKIICGDVLEELRKFPDNCIDTIITSPPYWRLRDYGVKGQIGLETTLDEYIDKLLKITSELKRVLKSTGVMFWNHGDSYATHSTSRGEGETRPDSSMLKGTGLGSSQRRCIAKEFKEKCLCLQNYRLIIEMISQGWILRNTIVWHKPNHMPSSVKDRFANSYEPVFMLVKNNDPVYHYNNKTGLMMDRKPPFLLKVHLRISGWN